jgi:hypothetical protein
MMYCRRDPRKESQAAGQLGGSPSCMKASMRSRRVAIAALDWHAVRSIRRREIPTSATKRGRSPIKGNGPGQDDVLDRTLPSQRIRVEPPGAQARSIKYT